MVVITSVLWDTTLCRQYIVTDAWEEPVSYKKCSFEFERVMYNSIPTEVHDARSMIQRERQRDRDR